MLSPAARHAKMKAVIRATSGNFLEAYDYVIYGFCATYIAAKRWALVTGAFGALYGVNSRSGRDCGRAGPDSACR